MQLKFIAKQFVLISFLFTFSAFAQTPTPRPVASPTSSATPTPTPAPVQVPVQNVRGATPPPQYIPAHDYDQRNIKLDLRFDWEHEQLIGKETITFAPVVKNMQSLNLDAAFMTITTAATASGAPLKFEYDANREKLSVLLDRAYQPNDEVTVVIS